VTFIVSLIESSDFLGFSESRADYGVPIAEFFCGVIFKAMKPHDLGTRGITTPQYILKKI
jgi:hypothetical protein